MASTLTQASTSECKRTHDCELCAVRQACDEHMHAHTHAGMRNRTHEHAHQHTPEDGYDHDCARGHKHPHVQVTSERSWAHEYADTCTCRQCRRVRNTCEHAEAQALASTGARWHAWC